MSGPIVIGRDSIRLSGLTKEMRDQGDDDCEYFDRDINLCSPCGGDGHFMCYRCKSYDREGVASRRVEP